MEQTIFQDAKLKEFCETGRVLYTNGALDTERRIELQDKLYNQFKEVMAYCFEQLNINQVMFSRSFSPNRTNMYLGGMFKYKDNNYKFQISSLYYCGYGQLNLNVLPMCKTCHEESDDFFWEPIWRKQKNLLLQEGFKALYIFKFPRPAKCTKHDLVRVSRRYYNDEKYLGRIVGVTVCGPVYYSVKPLNKSGRTFNYITEGRLTKIKKGL